MPVSWPRPRTSAPGFVLSVRVAAALSLPLPSASQASLGVVHPLRADNPGRASAECWRQHF